VTISGVVVACRKEHLEGVIRALEELSFVDVHHVDERGRLVITIEAADIEASVGCLKDVKALPHVAMAELAEFCIEENDGPV
jgi:nitrate reductase NapAB chaperone NapD